jgi:3-hydroxyacyl-CoA dehydrogenase/enoyl-CoA hydratase/3-hydroxybutyryl-CoA epimerase
MPLVEVVRGPQSDPQMVAKAAAFAARIGKTIVLVGDCAGFLVNRILAPYMNEAGHLVAEVEDPLEIDRAAIEFGMPMGPLALIDLVGIGVSSHVSENLRAAYGERMEPAPIWQALRQSTDASRAASLKVIQKTWFGKRLNPAVQAAARSSSTRKMILSHEEIIQRLVYPLINEAARCLEERIVEKADDVDLAMVFGTGFAPFRGGPLRYADSVGLPQIVKTLERLSAGAPRFTPCDRLRRMAAAGERFHPADL